MSPHQNSALRYMTLAFKIDCVGELIHSTMDAWTETAGGITSPRRNDSSVLI